MFTGTFLSKIKTKALRTRVWFKLDNLKKEILNCSIRVLGDKEAKSWKLIEVLKKIVLEILEKIGLFRIRMRKLGCEAAQRMAKTALKINLKEFFVWIQDPNYIEYLGRIEYQRLICPFP